jgi:hypothetical protein
MKLVVLVSIGIFAARGLAKAFEPANFNVTKALIKNGVNISSVPELADLEGYSSLEGCSIAVSICQSLSGLLLSTDVNNSAMP